MLDRPCPGCGSGEARPFAEKNGHRLLRCRRCATLRTADTAQNEYEQRYQFEGEVEPFLARRLDDIVAGFAPWRRSGRLLDVGFGTGDMLEASRRAGWAVSGVEIAKAAVERARRRGIDAVHGTLAEARYETESFDVVLAVELFEHVVDVAPLVAEIARLLRPGGLLWVTTPHGRGLSARLLGKSWSVINPPEHVQLFSIRGIRELLGRAGFATSIRAESVNPHEIVQHVRGAKMRPGQRIGSAYALNSFFEERRGRRAIKRAINGVLSMLRLGDSLKIYATKTPARSSRS